MKRKTVNDIRDMKNSGEKIAALTAYDCYHAKLLDEAGLDILLVGDSLGMVFAGYENTLPVTVDDIFYHASTVARGAREAMIVADMPFLSYQVTQEEAVRNCGRFVKAGVAQAVKIEGGGSEICSLVSRLVSVGIPVMGHVGLTPQLIHTLGGFRAQGKTDQEAEAIVKASQALEKAGVFSLVLESIPSSLAGKITASLQIPTIGIGAGMECDGQILVTSDLLGMFDAFKPKFARRYAQIGKTVREAVAAYRRDVKERAFPGPEESMGR